LRLRLPLQKQLEEDHIFRDNTLMNLPETYREFFQHNKIVQFVLLSVTFFLLTSSLFLLKDQPSAITEKNSKQEVLGFAEQNLTTNGVPLTSFPSASSSYPFIISDSAGGAFVAWSDDRTASFVGYIQRLDNNGSKLWAANGIAVSGCSTVNDLEPDGSGGFYLMCNSRFLYRFNSSGTQLWGPVTLFPATVLGSNIADIKVDSSGNVFAVGSYVITSESDYEFFGHKIDSNGNLLWGASGIRITNDNASNVCGIPGVQVVPDYLGGMFAVWEEWVSCSLPQDRDIKTQRLDSTGVTQFTANGINLGTGSGAQRDPVAVTDNHNGILVIYQFTNTSGTDLNGYYLQRISSTGTLTAADPGIFVQSGQPNGLWLPYIEAISDSNIIIHTGQSSNTFLRYDINLNQLTAVSATGFGYVQFSRYGNYLMTTTHNDGCGYLTNSGGTFEISVHRIEISTTRNLTASCITDHPAYQYYPRILALSETTGIALWHDHRNSGVANIYYQRFTLTNQIQMPRTAGQLKILTPSDKDLHAEYGNGGETAASVSIRFHDRNTNIPITDSMTVNMTQERIWTNTFVGMDTGNKTTFVQNLIGSDGLQDSSYVMYVRRELTDTKVKICPNVNNLPEITTECFGGYDMDTSNPDVTTVTDNGWNLWRIQGLTGSAGAISYIPPTPTPTPVPTTPVPTPTAIPAGYACNLYTNNTPVTIAPDSINTITSTINVPITSTITDINIRDLNILHTYNGDLTIKIKSPNNTTVTLYDQWCGDDDNIDVEFDDNAGISHDDLPCPPIGGIAYLPYESLSVFNGQNPQGNWELEITDNYDEDGGQLSEWSLQVCYALPPTPTPTATATPAPTSTPTAAPTTVAPTPTPTVTPTASLTPTLTQTPTPAPDTDGDGIPDDEDPTPNGSITPTPQVTFTSGILPNIFDSCSIEMNFTTDKVIIVPDGDVNLSWQTLNAATVTLTPDGRQLQTSGTLSLKVPQTTTFILKASNSTCSEQRTITIFTATEQEQAAASAIGTFTAVQAATVTASTVTTVATGAATVTGSQTFNLGLAIFDRVRRRKAWGAVYDSVSKKPIGRAIIRLYDELNKKLVQTAVSDANGIFRLVVKRGVYTITAIKKDYSFPSEIVKGKNDGSFANIYDGTKITVNHDSEVLSLSIPMDNKFLEKPSELLEIWTKGLQIFEVVNTGLVIAGVLYSIYATLINPSFLNILILGGYVVFLGIRYYLATADAAGIVRNTKGKSMAGLEIGLYEAEFNTLVTRTFTDDKGKYSFYVPEGDYYIKIIDDRYTIANGDKLPVKNKNKSGTALIAPTLTVKELHPDLPSLEALQKKG
jgi:subtilisin-like proprotein convertase family protein